MKGYKVLDGNLCNQYGFQYEFNKIYSLNGKLVWRENGFHFCSKPETTLKYADKDKDYVITTIDALGNIVCGDDYFENRYYGITGLYATDKYVITGTISIDEVISMIIKSNDVERARFLNMYLQLTPNQIDLLLEKYGEHIEPYIEYYQYHNPDAFNDYYKLKRTL
jgi:hypothetical protein